MGRSMHVGAFVSAKSYRVRWPVVVDPEMRGWLLAKKP